MGELYIPVEMMVDLKSAGTLFVLQRKRVGFYSLAHHLPRVIGK
jgi:hypothetical protein